MYYAYILISEKSGKYYVGHSSDLAERIKTHNAGKVISTRNKGPWACVYFEEFDSRLEANRREIEIKSKKSRKYIEELIINKRK